MIPFSTSQQSSLGIEWEIALADRESGDLVSAADELLAAVKAQHGEFVEPEGLAPQVTGEFLANTVEAVTGVCTTVAEATQQLERLAGALQECADPLGIDLYSAGTHPFTRWSDQPVNSKDRYQKVLDRTQYWGRQMLIYGVHVHVGLDSRDKALPVVRRLVRYYPHLLALTASSPYWEGVDTGYASQRAMIFQQLPASGIPYQFASWSEYSDYIDGLIAADTIAEESENRWDIRPVARFGTVEMRVCDGLATIDEIGAVAALTQCIVEEASRAIDDGQTVESLPHWFAQENKWRAARYGLDADVITAASGSVRPVRVELEELVERLAPLAKDLGCASELAYITTILAQGPGYVRQRRVFEESGGSLRDVVTSTISATRTGRL
ncbi:glutamate--cysteine ligase [uncultured Kocuria sp.]|uniref:glutamate--cysteine ligase n=1 Tax=uncultured Kocuria sp. TaxID=259305 RepID=UPI0025936583|nr:glutamate--cysteine ligase [uncultured Kocuria sp.]MCT1367268.1 glutamate--cysteine ligase [Rothia sp. p3-SID1597]